MTQLVVDASIFGPLLIPDEKHNLIPGLFDRIVEQGALAPQHWPLEVVNTIRMAVRRNRLPATNMLDVVAKMRGMDIGIDSSTGENAWSATLELATKHDLTVYDAAYLELSLRRALPLATLDAALARAARAENVEVLTA